MRFLLSLLLAAAVGVRAEGWQCWKDASERYNVPVELLYAIALVETGNRYNVVSKRNRNGTYDIGLMQINSAHLPELSRYGITERDLLKNPCLNLHVGAWILAKSIARHGYNWVAIGAYNASSMEKRKTYARKVITLYRRILQKREET